ncbi:MAG: DUF2239 family protein [FCB group bacterium]|jgi:hypothetical protein|nr:DUF2239 family protein [FCB group bacterium]
MGIDDQASWIAFARSKRVASGSPREVAAAVKNFVDANAAEGVLVFDATTSQPVEIDLRGSLSAVLKRLRIPQEPPAPPEAPQATSSGRPGRPRLGVVAREVTLLPRHWEWLAAQPGGASVTLRRLVEDARRAGTEADRLRRAQEAAYRFMTAMGGNEPGYEEATRALFAGDLGRLREYIAGWPRDVRDHTLALAEAASRCDGNDDTP